MAQKWFNSSPNFLLSVNSFIFNLSRNFPVFFVKPTAKMFLFPKFVKFF